jgi:hypothetical protein
MAGEAAHGSIELFPIVAILAAGVAAGRSLEELQESITMDAYSEWGAYENWLPLNIEGMHRILSEEG